MKKRLLALSIIVLAVTSSVYAQADGSVSSAVIIGGLEDTVGTVWDIVRWICIVILMITGAIIAAKTAFAGGGHDKTGGWIAVIGCFLVAIGLTFVPTIAETLFGVNF